MKKQNLLPVLGASVGMLVLIFDGKTAISGAIEGIELCFQVLIPSLFPFFILSMLLTGSLHGQSFPLLRPLVQVCRIPQGSESLLPAGFLGGYPAGAQSVEQLYRSGRLTREQAEKLLPLCNNAGPAFIFGVLGGMFSRKYIVWLLWLVQILSALAAAALLPAAGGSVSTCGGKKVKITDALERSVRAMGLVCGWVVLMRIVLAFLERWFLWLLPDVLRVAAVGILELSNGCVLLKQIPQEGLRFILAGCFLSLGGICVTLQTASVADGLPLTQYFPGKLLQGCFSILLCSILQPLFPRSEQCSFPLPVFAFAGILLLSAAVIYRTKNNSRISSVHSV